MFTIGVEEEFHVVDPVTRAIVPDADVVAAHLDGHADLVDRELQAAVLETSTSICHTLAEVRDDVTRSRRLVQQAAHRAGRRIVAAGTLPLFDLDRQQVTATERFEQMLGLYQLAAREQLICGAQTHVAFPDRESGIEICNRVRPWLPVLLALSASSPFWAGGDSGYASYRSQVWARWPTSGMPSSFASADEYDGLVKALVASGTITDEKMVYYDVRLSARYDTVEVRIPDACPRVDDVVLLTGLARALARTACDEVQRGVPAPDTRHELFVAAKWQATRFGLTGGLLDVVERETVPAAVLVQRLLAAVRPALEAEGDWDEVTALAAEALGRPSSPERQRQAYRRSGRLTDVVDLLIDETTRV